MKQLHYFLCLVAVVLLGFKTASAETVTGYTVDFNTTISTSDHAFKVAPGWKHIVKYRSSWNNTYQVYNYLTTVGVDNTGGLYAGSQPNGTANKDNMDMLVTPAVTGAFSLDVKKDTNSGSIFFYLIDEDESGALTVGDELTYEATLSTSEYVTLSFSGIEGKRIGIALNYMNIDNFAADQVDIVLEKALTVTAATSSLSSGSVNCDAEGNYSFTYTITVKNTGECDLAADDEGMMVGIAQYQNLGSPVATAPIGQALAMGESATIEVTANLNYAQYGSRTRFDAVECMTGTSLTVTPWVEPIPYVAKIQVRDADNNDMGEYPSYASAFGAFGMVNSNVSKTLNLRNTGAAPGEVTITVPEGFIAEPAALTVPAGETVQATITIDASSAGIKSGDMVIAGPILIDDAIVESLTIALSGTVLDQSKWFVNFEDQAIPAGCIVEEDSWKVNTNSYTISDDNKRYLESQARNLHKFITPLLKVEEGEKMTFDVGRLTSYASEDILLNVYYSVDRVNWTLLTTVPSADLPSTKNSGYSRQYLPKTVVLEGVPAGEVYIAFEAGYVYIDNLYGFELVPVAHDVIVDSSKIPASAMANNDYTATVTLKNVLGEAEAADGYTAKFYFNGKVVAEAEAKEIPAQGTASFEFTFTPNEPGTFPAYAEFDFGEGYLVATDAVEVTVAEESGEAAIIVGDPDGALTSSSSYANPITNYYRNGWSEALYTPAMLEAAGMTEGNKITSVTYMGYNPGEVTDNIKVYILSTEEETMAPFAKTDVTELTPVWANEEYKFTVMGSSDAPVDLFKVELAQPIVWDGKSLRIVVASDRVSGSDTRTQFLADASLGGELYYGRSDSQSSSAITSLSSAGSYFPVTKFGVEKEPLHLTGVVQDAEGNPLEGVTVTATGKPIVDDAQGGPRKAASGDVVYTGTTNENGEYDIAIIQADKNFSVNFSKAGFESVTLEDVLMNDDNLALDPVTLNPELPTAVEDVKAATVQAGNVYSIDGRLVRKNATGVAGLQPGIYIFNGKKVLVK